MIARNVVRERLARGAGILLPPLILSQFLLPLCALLFQCGCTTQGTEHCNIHQPASMHCPWCSHGDAGWMVPVGILLAAIALTLYASRAWWSARLLRWIEVAAASVVGWSVAVGAATVWWTGYPRLLWWRF